MRSYPLLAGLVIKQAESSHTPPTIPYCGASLCQPIGAPGRVPVNGAPADKEALLKCVI
jgi:hypothetical protein